MYNISGYLFILRKKKDHNFINTKEKKTIKRERDQISALSLTHTHSTRKNYESKNLKTKILLITHTIIIITFMSSQSKVVC